MFLLSEILMEAHTILHMGAISLARYRSQEAKKVYIWAVSNPYPKNHEKAGLLKPEARASGTRQHSWNQRPQMLGSWCPLGSEQGKRHGNSHQGSE